MHAEERHQAILRRLREGNALRVTQFAAELGVSSVTIRRDVEILAERGLVVRVHGGAMLPGAWAETAPVDGGSTAPQPVGRDRTFGLIVPSAGYYYPEVIKGAREAAAAHGVRLVLGISEYNPHEERAHARQMVEDGVDGLLVAPSDDSVHEWCSRLPVPVVLVERRPVASESPAEYVASDHTYGAHLAVTHLAGIGRRRIALLVRAPSPTGPWVIDGYRAGLRAAGLQPPEGLVFDIGSRGADDARYDRPNQELADAVAGGQVDAVIVHPDNEALALLRRLRAGAVKVPDDVAILAYDDEVAALADIPLSAIAPAKHEVGASAVDLLVRRLDRPGAARHRLLVLPELRVRHSTGT
ncbi:MULTISPECIES: substrate-binding domain-containing protein [unclassified Streptomyces]|uniref:substrate-binding domain-containing protein n=1 Tax=unclassified Streptomyces TaxID=2593676 RepID=UPI002E1032B2|nr:MULTISPECIES: substrate-binding domain-containing protein [unclassified Streptomyces]WSF88800.1 substrate-binding domain-containing protein [Streptomyces sp. NBC_01744]WSJ55053.1 substrate-binding domain-containing protein [Streptomyces sp. NBC_01318]